MDDQKDVGRHVKERETLATEGVEDTSSPGDFVPIDAQMLKDYDEHMRQLRRQGIAQRVDWMGNVLPPMLIEPYGHRVNRLGRKMSDEDRALRAQWVRDQHLAPDEPKFIPEMKPRNVFRRFFTPFWDNAGRAVNDKWGNRVAFHFRFWVPRMTLAYFLGVVAWYHMKYHPFSWEETSGWRKYYSRPVIWPSHKDYPIRELNAEDFFDHGFTSRKVLKNES